MKPDPINDLYQLMDEAGLSAGNLLSSSEPMSQRINKVRTELASRLKKYILEREASNGQRT